MKRNWKTIKKRKAAGAPHLRNPVAMEMLVTKRDFYTTKINNKRRKENRKKVTDEEEDYEETDSPCYNSEGDCYVECDCLPASCGCSETPDCC